jgi:hypothetical protein
MVSNSLKEMSDSYGDFNLTAEVGAQTYQYAESELKYQAGDKRGPGPEECLCTPYGHPSIGHGTGGQEAHTSIRASEQGQSLRRRSCDMLLLQLPLFGPALRLSVPP